jgi:methionyl-tRNA synthetase
VSPESTFYVTTPIYYVNGRPHIGHAYTTIAADMAARWHRLKGDNVFFLTGTDEHGQKVLEKAIERGMTAQEHVDDMVKHWKASFEKLEIQYDRFMRTTDDDHVANVKSVLTHLHDKGLFYKAEYTGWYHVGDEIFVTEKDIEEGKYERSELSEISESNWWFKMSAYQQQLLDTINSDPDFIQPEGRRNEVLGFLNTKTLTDLCISRPKSRMNWGIGLPFDDEFVTYVWFDALLNYLTGTGYTADGTGTPPEGFADWSDLWPANFQIIGKDILTTHAVYWMTMLMALEVPLPKTLFAHGWWVSSDGQKMGKRHGNTIDIDLLVQEFGVDAVRYFFLREIRFGNDGAFSYEGFMTRYNADLANDLGNLAHRGISMTTNWLGGVVPEYEAAVANEEELKVLATQVVKTYNESIDAMRFDTALEALWELVKAGNKYIDTSEPWKLNREGDMAKLRTAKRVVLEICYLAATLLLPVIPNKSRELLKNLGRNEFAAKDYLKQLVSGTPVGLDALPAGIPLTYGDPLFPRHKELPEAIQKLFEAPKVEEKEAEPEPEVKLSKRQRKEAERAERKAKELAYQQPIDVEHFKHVQLRAGVILSAEAHPNADKLLVVQVDIGEDEPRQIVAGIATKFGPDEVVGRKVVVVSNLAPANLRGIESQGMLLAAGAKDVVDLVSVDAEPGEVIR